jgi:uncharacterized tellurite resistance protein B-like protein
MLRGLKDLFDTFANPAPASPADEEHALQLACAVLLVEVMRADQGLPEAERDVAVAALHRKFPLAPDEVDRLLELAHEKARTANDFYGFTSTLNERFSQAQKVRIVETMWQVAYADGRIEENENHLISRVAGLLHVTHGEYIAAKLHARQASGLGAP